LRDDTVDPECDIAVATMAQLLLQQGKVTEALVYFERAAELSRTEGEIVNALSYAEATRTQLEVCVFCFSFSRPIRVEEDVETDGDDIGYGEVSSTCESSTLDGRHGWTSAVK
jgi:hypothetical protein